MLQHEYEGFNVALGENIKRLRRDAGWTQGDLADKAGIRVGQISKLERNEADPKLDTLYKLMEAFGCSPNALLNDVKKTNLDGLMEMALERAQQLPDVDKQVLLKVIDRYCIAISMQDLIGEASKSFLGLNRLTGKTEELSSEQQ
ncbi:helix-turn-helix transcriptional regulator [Gilvimarinus sp. SDUM040013]|uniref:Helix-turn-helix transcriptional regulator n=1 Tax=Gilvimarinus gilvus TaxID=3058038 RepID=A0ABU4S312_9GAMM|nr:helix-turn-helix transcriptional regulator [Gilvimarinus sp. SDUM040013]MDO3385648.1 helix-turn-helix transcriptional regulator [Gilvimarinus sp. SDUM040013]MDX6851562.1 helix-turn-helix transcriptional regulator [Gilvimarinus sp. SDUM040013]